MSDTPVNPFDDAEEIAKKSMVLFFLIDCSGSMGGSKIGTVNSVMEELIPEIKGIGGADADIKLAVLKFSGGCEWMYDEPISIDEFEWKPLDAENVTDLGCALTELAAKLSRNEFMKSPSLSFAPVMILMSDGYPTDNYEKGLDILSKNRWYSNGIKAAVAIGEDADHDILARFTGDPDSVVTAHNGEALAKLIKFVAVTSSQIGSRSVRLAESEEDMRTKQQSAAELPTRIRERPARTAQECSSPINWRSLRCPTGTGARSTSAAPRAARWRRVWLCARSRISANATGASARCSSTTQGRRLGVSPGTSYAAGTMKLPRTCGFLR